MLTLTLGIALALSLINNLRNVLARVDGSQEVLCETGEDQEVVVKDERLAVRARLMTNDKFNLILNAVNDDVEQLVDIHSRETLIQFPEFNESLHPLFRLLFEDAENLWASNQRLNYLTNSLLSKELGLFWLRRRETVLTHSNVKNDVFLTIKKSK